MKNSLLLLGISLFLCLGIYHVIGSAAASANSESNIKKQYGMNTIPGEGSITRQTREIEPFTSIFVNAPVEVTVVQGNQVALTLTGYANHLSLVKIQMKDGQLVFLFDSNGRQLPPDQKIRATVELPGSLISLFARGQGKIDVEKKIQAETFTIDCSNQGDITMADLQTGKLTMSISDQGDVKLAGTATNGHILVTNQGDGDLKRLKIDTADCTASGQGDCTVYVEGKLKAVVSGQGDITYYGNPKHVEQQVSGQADLTKGN